MPNKKVIVSKFGGSSMADAKAITRSAEICKLKSSSVVVVSATYGTTNELIELSQLAKAGKWNDCEALLGRLYEKHIQIGNDLGWDENTRQSVEEILTEAKTLTQGIYLLKDCSAKALDSLMSVGERTSAHLLVVALRTICPNSRVEFMDVRKIVKTNDRFGKATPNTQKIREASDKYLLDCKYSDTIFVTQGFIGSTDDDQTTTLGRGGSDYSAALIAEGLKADVLEIWTDVAGIATTDPRICKDASPINQITFQEAAELATFGAKILHPTTLAPAMRANIPVFVGSSYEPEEPGTWICNETEQRPLIRAMAVKRDQVLLTVSTPKMLHAHGYLAKIFEIFNRHQISVDAITTSEISVAMTVDKATLSEKALFEELQEIAQVEIEENLSIVSLIGNSINHTPGLAQKIFNGLQSENELINVRMICLGASKHNFCLIVSQEQADEAIRRLHKTFITKA